MNKGMRKLFDVSVKVAAPILVGQDDINGRRQLIPILEGSVDGIDMDGNSIHGEVMPGGVDSQVIRPNGRCELSARYAVRLDSGASFYIENNGIRTVPEEYITQVLKGEFIDPSLYYFATTPNFEVYDSSLAWLENHIFVCKATRRPDRVDIAYFVIE